MCIGRARLDLSAAKMGGGRGPWGGVWGIGAPHFAHKEHTTKFFPHTSHITLHFLYTSHQTLRPHAIISCPYFKSKCAKRKSFQPWSSSPVSDFSRILLSFPFFRDFPRFHWFFPGIHWFFQAFVEFPSFHWVFPDFSDFPRILLISSIIPGFHLFFQDLIDFSRISLTFPGFYWFVQDFIDFSRILLSFSGFSGNLLWRL